MLISNLISNSNYGKFDDHKDPSPVNEYFISDFGSLVSVKKSIIAEMEQYITLFDSVMNMYPDFYPRLSTKQNEDDDKYLEEIIGSTGFVVVRNGKLIKKKPLTDEQRESLLILKEMGVYDGCE